MKALGTAAVLIALSLVFVGVQPASAASADPAVVIQLINEVRAEYGLPPYAVDSTLMALAQSHSAYMASSGNITHTGADGSSAKDRVVASGYGSAGVSVHENIYAGWEADAWDAVVWWRNSPIHFEGMTLASAENIGVGVVVDGANGLNYYTAIFASSGDGGGGAAPPPAPPAPVEVSEAAEDGGIWHTVQVGQTVSLIATYYGVPVEDVLALNGLTEDTLIYAGDVLLIQAPPTPEPAPTPTPIITSATEAPGDAAEDEPPPTEAPPTPTPVPTATIAAAEVDPEAFGTEAAIRGEEEAVGTPDDGRTLSTLVIVLGVVVIVALAFAAGYLWSRRQVAR